MPAAQLRKLPAKAREIWEAAYEAAEEDGKEESRAAQIAWGAVKNAGFRKGEDDKWHKMHLAEMYFTKASRVNGEMRWAATVSKFEPDVQADEVTPQFYKYAAGQVESGRRPPPVVCISHIDRGKPDDSWAAGDVLELYIDGDRPKAKGTFRDTPLGQAAFATVVVDVKNKVPHEDRARISMGFFDEGSEPRVTKADDGTEKVGSRFLQGWIKHLALTRVPVVTETEILAGLEAKSMGKLVTRKEDATSIVGEELADELLSSAEKADLTATDLIVKQAEEEEEEEEGTPEEEEAPEEGEEEEEEEEEEKANYAEISGLLTQLLTLLKTEFTVDTEVANAAALGSRGTEPARAEQVEERSVPYAAQVAAVVDNFATIAKQTLLTDGDRQDKFSAIQEQLNTFGEDVVTLVKEQTPPSSRDVAEAVQTAIKSVAEPLQNELASVKAELATLKAQYVGMAALPQTVTSAEPQSLDTRARVANVEDATPTLLHQKAWKVKDLAFASTAEPRY